MKNKNCANLPCLTNSNFEGVCDITCQTLSKNMNLCHLIDVREEEEFERLPKIKQAQHIPLNEILDSQKCSLPLDKPIVFICRSGKRSARASCWAIDQSLRVYNLKGGMLKWYETFGEIHI